jgi:hypothetical protein
VLGDVLTEATVIDQSILGGTTMVAYRARWDLLGSGALPALPPAGLSLADEVDVADLASETAHHYVLGDAWDTDNQVAMHGGPHPVADGGRLRRSRDAFRVALPAGKRGRLVMRVSAETPVDLAVTAAGREAGSVLVEDASAWVEVEIDLPAGLAGETAIVVTARPRNDADGEPVRFGAFHYWLYAG